MTSTDSVTRCRPVVELRNSLGESPVWDERDEALWWVDIPEARIHRLHPASGNTKSWIMPERVAALALCRSGGLIIALASGFARFDPSTGAMEPVPVRPELAAGQRLNDGRCDPAGRFWCGAMREEGEEADADLHVLRADGGITLWQRGLRIANGLNWSPDGQRFYVSDTPEGIIYVHDFDRESGRLGEARIFHDGADVPGSPDGAAVDAEGFLWSARYGGGGLARFRPDGELDRFLPLPVRDITCCAFGGPDLRSLYVTSASEGLDGKELAAQPWAGRLMVLDAGVPGLPALRFAG
ncbi:SMP-30/gluconolactonase/LRE family protein [Roseomonas marmotae]|uniref:SMP-30/gluconolactonase/LRE family protein n=1 Tax=Roseomonas marmotae TaxID=2768161 RepID=A0ABS3KEN4_9PROT|nr:SMP-30/gluconolactonase/LRE family protein [Roseomonas marmotae]MBO1075410.1 SMP-30/gluconolactonase/LRE family protein [Roseomonas marmotae]QTI78397.1 SMP-30/gluconolactonase/LRE family protein [Roseomonas marmotae]